MPPDGPEAPLRKADYYGNNLAVECPACGKFPVLLIARRGWPGSREDRAALCQRCKAKVWLLSPVEAGIELEEIRVTYRPGAP